MNFHKTKAGITQLSLYYEVMVNYIIKSGKLYQNDRQRNHDLQVIHYLVADCAGESKVEYIKNE